MLSEGFRAVFLTLLLSWPALGESFVSGVVRERVGDQLAPAAGVAVYASAEGVGVVAVADSDAAGQYVLRNLPAARYRVFLDSSRFLITFTNGRRAHEARLTCTVEGECGSVDFELVRGGAVEGYVVDTFGEPLQDVSLKVRGIDPEADSGLGDYIKGGGSDDRGYFRLWGVTPGTYHLVADPLPVYHQGPQYTADPVRVTVQSGEEVSGLQIVMQLSEVYWVWGRVVSLPDDGKFREIRAREVSTPEGSGRGFSTILGSEGRFSLEGLSSGVYVLSLGTENLRHEYGYLPLGALEVTRNLEDVILRPLPPTGVRGKLLLEGFEDGADIHAPEFYSFGLHHPDGQPVVSIQARAPGWEFERTDLPPGEYDLRPGFYVPYLKNPNEAADGPVKRIHVSEGKIETLSLVLSARGSRITGRVWTSRSGDQEQIPASHYRVGLRIRHGNSKYDRQSVVADQEGRFSFGLLRPGEYEICAWPDLDRQEVRGTQAWEEAGESVRRFTLKEEMDVEIDLTAVP